jgi:hypothetical protein
MASEFVFGPIAQNKTYYVPAPYNCRIAAGSVNMNANATASKKAYVKYIDSSSSQQTIMTFTVPASYAAATNIAGSLNSSSSSTHAQKLLSRNDPIVLKTDSAMGNSAETYFTLILDRYGLK